ncbi:MAG: CTP synthase (glutamine hydrolyzing) [Nanoarchaeota archaeon]|nr:CTP synthase (glutamine hydrolyzing) [Nanoarchaeota archaeon]
MTKYIVVTGGVLSGLGKGIAAASIGQLFSQDYKVVPIKCDGYLNVDPGTMNPVEHGEVFVLEDGTEVDMDFGHYERFINTSCTGRQNLTMGKVFHELYLREREGDYLGKTVQFVPHATNYILNWWKGIGEEQEADIVLIEIGGTVGDMENELYLEAARRLQAKEGKENVMFVHLTYVPIPAGVNEQKSKPTQQSVSLLMQRGIYPDILLPRCSEMVTPAIKRKIAMFCNVSEQAVISAIDVDSVYKIPLVFQEQGLVEQINVRLQLYARPDLSEWEKLIDAQEEAVKEITIALCGKYTALEDSYASVVEALKHCEAHEKVHVVIKWVDTEHIDEESIAAELKGVQGVIVPGGFGSRGIEGKIEVIRYCREQKIPYLGLCYGLQLAVVEFARHVMGLDAHTTEIDADTPEPIIDILPDKKDLHNLGGTLRLGAYPALLEKNSLAFSLYQQAEVSERHRHRYEVNPAYHSLLEKYGLTISGKSPDGRLVEFIELSDHPYFIATQAHPELKSSLLHPAPLFQGLVKAAKDISEKTLK